MSLKILRTKDNVNVVMGFLRNQVTEDRTDKLIDTFLNKIDFPKWIPKFIVRKVLDAMLPDKVLDSLEHFLLSLGDETPKNGEDKNGLRAASSKI